MRLSLIALVPLTALLSVVHAHSDYTYEAREHINELATRDFEDSLLTTRQELADLSTRELLNELEDRLQRRGRGGYENLEKDSRLDTVKDWIKKKLPSGRYYCISCGTTTTYFKTEDAVLKHINFYELRHDLWIKDRRDVTISVKDGKAVSIHVAPA
ncbi:hypothetical protein DFP72DRAFT_1072657 [Ephemerocybe angulata]|uniref:Uncharacterized protein n=1 Tax=Ephemerocybe angulata TaxID=980116 RepID=A0A8H6HN18_9AGAR|nr:hypothetical protein DFP72DRAFT_1072657 [Tulosesus angulatus]